MVDNDYDKFAESMEKKYPLMFADKYGGFDVGPGWWPIIQALCANIQHHINWTNEARTRLLKDNPWNNQIPDEVAQVVVGQIKEKFGGLRFYYTGGDDKIDGMVRMAESWAGKVCEECGKPGKSRDTGWVKTLCDDHYNEYKRWEAQERNRSGGTPPPAV